MPAKNGRSIFHGAWALLLVSLLFMGALARGAEEQPAELKDVGIDPVLGSTLPLDANFVQEDGRTVPLRSFFDGRRPAVLVLAYYGCPMLCGLVLNSVRESLQRMDWKPGDHYEIVTISIDPKEDAALAAAKKKSIVGAATDPAFRAAAERDWHFLVGKAGSEKRVADALGFHYKWNPEEKQWAHGASNFFAVAHGQAFARAFRARLRAEGFEARLARGGERKSRNAC